MTDTITQTITDTILVDLGVKTAPVAPSPKLVPLPSGNATAREAEAASAQLWATYHQNTGKRKTEIKTPITSRHAVPVDPSVGAWEKDSVLNELERMREMYVDFRTTNQAVIKTKDFQSIVGIIGSDMLNCVEQAGFIVNGGASIDTLKTLISVWLSTHCKQLHEGAYVPVVVKD
tara:strand:- start:2161 stop:2685 length:525 start_codon:yes stop_codon:yes gene_type:complete